MLYTTKNKIKMKGHKMKIHKYPEHKYSSDIKHISVDHTGIVLTAPEDQHERTIKITSTHGNKIEILD